MRKPRCEALPETACLYNIVHLSEDGRADDKLIGNAKHS